MPKRKQKRISREQIQREGTTGEELDALVGKSKYFAGIYPDELLDKIIITALPISMIVNVRKQHWIALYISRNRIEIMDPLGGCFVRENLDLLRNFVARAMCQKMIYLTPKLQAHNSAACGLYSVYFVQQKSQNKTFKQILANFDNDYHENETFLLKQYTR